MENAKRLQTLARIEPDTPPNMANDHPFQQLFETLGRTPSAHSPLVNHAPFQILSQVLTIPAEKPGRCILLRAPRAGYGKTHLIARTQHHFAETHEFIPLRAGLDCRVDAASVTEDVLRRLARGLPASGGLTALDLVIRRMLAAALQPLVAAGEVPCQDREGALLALRTKPVKTFDFHHPNAVTAHWARKNFDVLGQRLSLELAHRSGLSLREVSFWVDVFFRFAAAVPENAGRVRSLAEAAQVGVSMERLEALLGLLTLQMRVVLVADDLEGFSSDETAALRLAAFLASLRHSVDRLDIILALNDDVWSNSFVPRLSGGLLDRLSEVVIDLGPLTEQERVALLDSRVPGLGARVLERVDLDSAGDHARGLIRSAGVAWMKAVALDQGTARPVSAPPAAAAMGAMGAMGATAVPTPAPAPVREPVIPAAEAPVQAPVQAVEDWRQETFSGVHGHGAEPANPTAVPSAAPLAATSLAPASAAVEAPFLNGNSHNFAHQAFEVQAATDFAATAPPAELQPAMASVADAPSNGLLGIDDLLRQFRERYGR